MTEETRLGDCIRCHAIRCLNLFEKSEKSEDIGNELQVYSILGKKIEHNLDLTAHVCINGRFLNAACFLTFPIYTDHKESYLSDILVQVTRDLKASIFLAFSGHYRQAMQVLRCAFENVISGIYFQSDLVNLSKKKAKAEDISAIDRRFNLWKKEGRVNIRKSIEVLRRIDFLTIEEQKEWNKLYNILSKFVHTPEDFVARLNMMELRNLSLALQRHISVRSSSLNGLIVFNMSSLSC